MKFADLPSNEKLRQQAVEQIQILDTLPEDSYDNITDVIAAICNAPIALITLIDNDRNFLKSRHGLEITQSPRDISFCSHTIVSEQDILIVPDVSKDERFSNNPIIEEQNVLFYAGVPLVNKEGYKLGTLCVFDSKPRDLNEIQINALKSMARHVMLLFEERQNNIALKAIENELRIRNQELKDFAGIVSHDLKTPLTNILLISEMLSTENKNVLSDQSKEYLVHLKNAGKNLSKYIDGMLDFYRSDEIIKDKLDDVSFVDLMEDLKSMTISDDSVVLNYTPDTDVILRSSNAALHQILLNLITNSVKYGDKPVTVIDVHLVETKNTYKISVADNGRGIPTDQIDHIFQLFYTIGNEDRYGKKGTGIGLATTKRLLDQLKGSIDINSEDGVGTIITIEIPKGFEP